VPVVWAISPEWGKVRTSGSSARAASAAVLIEVTCAVCSTVAAVMMMNQVVAWEKNLPTALSVRRSRSDRLAFRPWFSSTSCEACQKNMYGVMVVPTTAVIT
jgi:hypothetical protein